MPDTIILKIENCNNIDSGEIEIKEGCLNIKYGINGTGKTTIGKSIIYSINDRINSTNQLKNLHSFKFLGDNTKSPSLGGIDNYQNPVIFNEEYVNQYVFVVDEVVQNSFKVFIEDDVYKRGLQAIDDLIRDIETFFKEDQTIDIFIRDLNQFISYAGNSTSGLHKSSTTYKALSQPNLITNIPDGLEDYCDHIRSNNSISRISWQQQGQKDFFSISNKCPFCTQNTDNQKEKIELLNQTYDPKVIEHLQKTIQVLTSLANYFNDDTNTEIDRIKNKTTNLNSDDENYLFRIKQECEYLKNKLLNIQYINFNSLKNENLEKISDILEKHKIQSSQFVFLSSSASIAKFQEINEKIDTLLIRTDELKKRINNQNTIVGQRIDKSKENINAFLLYAGYQYHIDCIEENGRYKIIMKHNEGNNLVKGKDHLSFGERNAFALILFMFDAIKKNADLIILDDPISSFDKNKKYAILDMLFKTGVGIRGKTILMLTHDFEPIIDIIYNKKPKLDGVSAHFLYNKNGNLSEKIIKKNDICSFMDIAIKNINQLDEDVNKMIYLRRLYEINNNKNSAYQVLSNLFKKKVILENKDGTPLDQNIIDQGCSDINNDIPGFDYEKYCDQFNDIKYMVYMYEKSTNNFEKLQIYRIINNDNHTNNVVRKFINEAYHIENDYLFQLNPCEYEIVPEYIIEECNKDIEEIKTSF